MGLFAVTVGEDRKDLKKVVAALQANVDILKEYENEVEYILGFIKTNIEDIERIFEEDS
jgi:hypothetical protein